MEIATRKATYFGHQTEKFGTLELDSCTLRLTLTLPSVVTVSSKCTLSFFPSTYTRRILLLNYNRQHKQDLNKKPATTSVCAVMFLVAAK